ncbi:MAG TPA: amino acid ABC transporter permease, partial [Mycobacterium sp.]
MRVSAAKLAALLATVLLTYSLAPVAPVSADTDLCKPSGQDGAVALPRKLATANRPLEDKYTTADVEPLSSVNVDALGLRTPRTLTVGTQPGGPPTSCLNSAGRYTGYDNELLRAIAA